MPTGVGWRSKTDGTMTARAHTRTQTQGSYIFCQFVPPAYFAESRQSVPSPLFREKQTIRSLPFISRKADGPAAVVAIAASAGVVGFLACAAAACFCCRRQVKLEKSRLGLHAGASRAVADESIAGMSDDSSTTRVSRGLARCKVRCFSYLLPRA